jgi:putative transposase
MQMLTIIHQIRQDHPTMGLRDMYYKMHPQNMGRDRFEQFCKNMKLQSKRSKNYRRTTDSSGVIRFDNLLTNFKVERINQVWQNDISYYEVNGRFYYLTFILDSFSRRILGHQTSLRLKTEQTTLPALKMAIKSRRNQDLRNLIFHSDGGGQYYEKDFLKLTRQHEMLNSMCEYPWDNGKAERINGVIKNNYLKHRNIKTFDDLVKEVDRSVLLYNHDKPHIELKRKSPITFENEIILQHQSLLHQDLYANK